MRRSMLFLALLVGVAAATPAFSATQYCFNTPTPVPDNNPAGVTVSLPVPGTEAISNLTVSVVGTHTWVGDLRFTVSKGATAVTIIDRPGYTGTGSGCSANNYDVTLDDASGTPVEGMCFSTPPALSGTASPNNPLSAFDGQSVNGTWTLNVSDNALADTGTLTSWCLNVNGTSTKGDLNGDGRPEMFFRSLVDGAENKVWFMDGVTRTSEATITPDAASADWIIRGVDDFDSFTTPGAGQDAKQDLVFWNQTTGAVEFWLMNGVARPGAVVPLTGSTLPTNWDLSATADFNGDSKPDIVWRNFTSQKIVIWLMNGTVKVGNIIPIPDQAVDGNWKIVAAADYNNDGNRDFLWYNTSSGRIVTWYMNASAVRISGQFTIPDAAGDFNWKVLASADYSASYTPGTPPLGSPDIVWRNDTSGNQVVWHLSFASSRVHGQFTIPPANTPALNWVIVGPR